MSRYRFVAAEKAAARAVSAACAALEVSRSAYYQWSRQKIGRASCRERV